MKLTEMCGLVIARNKHMFNLKEIQCNIPDELYDLLHDYIVNEL